MPLALLNTNFHDLLILPYYILFCPIIISQAFEKRFCCVTESNESSYQGQW